MKQSEAEKKREVWLKDKIAKGDVADRLRLLFLFDRLPSSSSSLSFSLEPTYDIIVHNNAEDSRRLHEKLARGNSQPRQQPLSPYGRGQVE